MIFVLTKQKLVAWDDLQFDTGRDQIDRDQECVWESDIHAVIWPTLIVPFTNTIASL